MRTLYLANRMATSAQAETTPAPTPAPAARDSRQDFMPDDPLGLRPGANSISGSSAQTERITVLARSGVEPGLAIDERNRSRRIELLTVLLVIAAIAIAAFWFYCRRGHINFAGQGFNRE